MNESKSNMFRIMAVLLVGMLASVMLAGEAANERRFSKPVAEEVFGYSGLAWVPSVSYSALTLTVSTVEGSVISRTFQSGSAPHFDLSDFGDVPVLDGVYTYELRLTPREVRRSLMDGETGDSSNGVGAERGKRSKAIVQSGSFTILNGMIVNGNAVELSRSGVASDRDETPKDQVIADDLIVQSSLCVGFDCINGESFGFDTIRLKENNTRIKFDDTSASAGFPDHDWQLTANDSASGGANKFSIEDITASQVPFTIEGSAPTNSLYVDDGGRIGLGTATPVLDVHILSGNTPAIRLDQDTSSGWSAQVWDVAANEANFFVRDVTGGSKLPFRIQPGAPTNTLTLRSTGRVGIGTWSPEQNLEIEATGSNPVFGIQRTDGVSAKLLCSANQFQIGATTNHPIKFLINGTTAMSLNTNNYLGIGINPTYPLHMASGAHCTDGGVWTNASSITLKENVRSLSDAEAVQTISELKPVIFNYKNEKTEDYVGFIAEDVPQLVASSDHKSLSPMDVVAVLTKVVQMQQQTIEEMKKKIADLEKSSHK